MNDTVIRKLNELLSSSSLRVLVHVDIEVSSKYFFIVDYLYVRGIHDIQILSSLFANNLTYLYIMMN